MANERARRLRRNSTDAERRLWARLRLRQLGGARFRRQAPIGPYIVDFVCFECDLVIEIDGGQHDASAASDRSRTAWLETQGFRIVRFWNNEVLGNIDGVLAVIASYLAAETPHPDPPPQGGRGKTSD